MHSLTFRNLTLQIATIALVYISMGLLVAVYANEQDNYDSRLALSFADDTPLSDTRFEQFDMLHGAYDDTHELNDAWLGMPVSSSEGKVIGYVEDAILDNEGYMMKLVVKLDGVSTVVHVDGENTEYTETAVLIDLPLTQIASLESK